MNKFYNIQKLAEELQSKLNDNNVLLINVYPNEIYTFNIIGETDEFKLPHRVGNVITNFINGEYSVISSDVEGSGESTYNAVIKMRVDFLVPLKGPEKKNKLLLSCIREHVSNTLKYTEAVITSDNTTYTHITDYEILNTGIREQRDIVGDSINLTIFITHTFVALGVPSSKIILSVKKLNSDEYEDAAANMFGIARKVVSDTNVYAGGSLPETKHQPTSTIVTITADLLTRLRTIDYYVDRFVYDGILEPFDIKVSRPNPEYYINGSGEETITTDYRVIISESGVNAEIGTISTTSITMTLAAPTI